MSSSAEEVREQLIDMGVDPAKSYAASTMFGSVDAAINWVFGEGENVSWLVLIPSSDSAVAAEFGRLTGLQCRSSAP